MFLVAQMLAHFGFEHPLKETFGQGAVQAAFAENIVVIGVALQKAINQFIG